MEAFRAEFPGASAVFATVRRPSVARANVWNAFLAGIGVAFVVRAVVELAVVALFSLVFPATSPRPTWVTPSLFWDGAAELAAGMVLMRSGGIAPLALYVGLELLVLIAALPGRLFLCSRAAPALLSNTPCDFPAMLVARWPLWAALAIGVLAYRALGRHDDGEGSLLRAAGVFGLVVTVVTNVATSFYYIAGAALPALTLNGIFAVGQIVGGLAAGTLLWRSSLARPLLLAICLIGPAFAVGIPILRTQLPTVPTGTPLGSYLSLLSSVLVPIGGTIALFAGRALRREWGSFF